MIDTILKASGLRQNVVGNINLGCVSSGPTTLQWCSVLCKQMPSQTLDGSSYPSYEFGGKFKNSYKKWIFQHFQIWILGSFL